MPSADNRRSSSTAPIWGRRRSSIITDRSRALLVVPFHLAESILAFPSNCNKLNGWKLGNYKAWELYKWWPSVLER
jgi:hypothetical protein